MQCFNGKHFKTRVIAQLLLLEKSIEKDIHRNNACFGRAFTEGDEIHVD